MANNDKTISVMLKFGVEQEQKAKATLEKLGASFKTLEREAEKLKKKIEDVRMQGGNTSVLEKQLERVQNELKDTATEAAKLNRELENAKWGKLKQIGSDLSQTGDKIANIGRGMSIMGVGILAGVYASIQKFNEANPLDPTAQRWLKAQTEIERSFLRIGGVAADRLLPLIEKLADLAEKTADFVEKNPQLIDALVGLGSTSAVSGGVLQGIGGTMKLGGGVMDTVAKVGEAGWFAEGGAIAGLTTTITASLIPALGVLGTILGGAAIAGGGYEATARLSGKGAMNGDMAYLNEVATGGAYMMGQKFGKMAGLDDAETERKALVFAGLIGKMTGAIDESSPLWIKATDAVEESSSRIVMTAEESAAAAEAEAKAKEEATKAAEKRAESEKQLADAYAQYTQQEAEAARAFEASKTKITEDANRAALDAKRTHEQTLAKAEAEYTKQRADLLNNYKTEDAQAASKYQQDRAQAVRDGGLEIQKIEKDHQKRLAELLTGHNERMGDLIAGRDALGLVKENQAYEKSRREEEGNTNEEIGQRRRDIALKLSDMAQAYAAERAQRSQALQQSLAEAAQKHAIDLQDEQKKFAEESRQRKEQATRQLNDLTTQYREESVRRRNAFLQSIRDLDTALNGESSRKRQYYALMLKDAEAFMAQWRTQMYPSTPVNGNRASGGYVTDGIYRMGEVGTEFVANAQTTSALEQMAGGSLTQDRLLSLAARGGSSRSMNNVTLQQTVHFNGEDSASNRAQLRTLIHDVAMDAMKQVLVN